jgi:hypothetical protein
LWGHLTAIHDAMLPRLGLGDRFHPEFDVAFVSNPDKSQAAIPSHEQVRQAWKTVNGELSKGFEKMSWSDWLQRHTAVSEESVEEVVEAALTAVEQRTVPGFAGTPEELDTLLAEGLASKQLTEDEFWSSISKRTNALLAEHKTGPRS